MQLKCYYHDKGPDSLNFIQHTRPLFVFLQTFHPHGNVLINTKLYPMTYGGFYLIDNSHPFCTMPTDSQNYVRNKLIVSIPELTDFLKAGWIYDTVEDLCAEGGAFIQSDEETAQKIDSCFYRAYEGREDPAVCFLSLLEIIHLIKKVRLDDQNFDKGIIGNTLHYIDQNLCSTFHTEDIARRLHIIKYHLCHTFKEKCGMTISDYVLEKRLSLARRQLLETDKTIQQISMDCGFSSASYFGSVFRKTYGSTPKDFRKTVLWPQAPGNVPSHTRSRSFQPPHFL